MRTIIAGSRNIIDSYRAVEQATAESGFDISSVISGTARGIDEAGEAWAADNMIACHKYPADWKAHGKSAGYKRNQQMAENADALIAIWDGESKGTKHMIDIAERKGLKVFVYKYHE